MTIQEKKNAEHIAVLTERVEGVKADIKEIKENHLAHLSQDIKDLYENVNRINARLSYIGGGLAIIYTLFQLLPKLLK